MCRPREHLEAANASYTVTRLTPHTVHTIPDVPDRNTVLHQSLRIFFGHQIIRSHFIFKVCYFRSATLRWWECCARCWTSMINIELMMWKLAESLDELSSRKYSSSLSTVRHSSKEIFSTQYQGHSRANFPANMMTESTSRYNSQVREHECDGLISNV